MIKGDSNSKLDATQHKGGRLIKVKTNIGNKHKSKSKIMIRGNKHPSIATTPDIIRPHNNVGVMTHRHNIKLQMQKQNKNMIRRIRKITDKDKVKRKKHIISLSHPQR